MNRSGKISFTGLSTIKEKKRVLFCFAIVLALAIVLTSCGLDEKLKEEITAQTYDRIEHQKESYKKENSKYIKFSEYLDVDDVSYEIIDIIHNDSNEYAVSIKFMADIDKTDLSSTEKSLACYDMEKLFHDFSFDYNGRKISITSCDNGTTEIKPCCLFSSWINGEEIHTIEREKYSSENYSSEKHSKHKCEVCSKEGTHSIVGISGQIEYYCSEHYYEMLDIINSLK